MNHMDEIKVKRNIECNSTFFTEVVESSRKIKWPFKW